MSLPATPREALYTRLTEVLGNNEARTIMELLPEERSQNLATKADVADIEGSIDKLDHRIDKLDHRIDKLDRRIDKLDHRMDRFDDRMDRFEESLGKIERSMDKFDDRLHGFHEALRDQTRVFVLACTSAMVGVGTLAFAAARFVT